MKKILSVALLLSGITFTVFAQQSTKNNNKEAEKGGHKKEMVQKTPEEIAKMRTEHLDKVVKLTDKQREEVYALNLKNAKARQNQKDSAKKDREAHRNEMKASQEELNKILTADQQKVMAEKMSKKAEGKSGRHHEGKKGMKKGDFSSDKKEKSTS